MSFDAKKVIPEFQTLLGFRPHPGVTVPATLTTSDTGEYYIQKHSAVRLDLIQALLDPDIQIDQYLTGVVNDSTSEMLNDLIQYRNLKEYGKTILESAVLLDRYGWKQDVITNTGRFVGFQIRLKTIEGLKAVINEIGFQFSQPEPALKMYLFHTSKVAPIDTFNVAIDGNGNWTWIQKNIELTAFKSTEFHGGAFVLGYYQNNLAGNAINYSNFNWDTGVCSSCNNPHLKTWRSIRNNYHIYPMYVPDGSFTLGEMFDMDKAIFNNSQSFGLNLRVSVHCDLTGFFIQNKFAFKNLLGYKVATRILNDMKFSNQINNVEENIKMMVIRDLEGDIDTKLQNLPSKYHNELKSVSFNISAINGKCLGCESQSTAPQYGVV